MNKKVNPVTIGVFVVSATMLAFVALMIFGAAKFFAKTSLAVCYFKDSINGLDVGAPVKYKGVTIGKVKDININVSPNDVRKSSISVFVAIDLDAVKRRTSRSEDKEIGSEEGLIEQINDGLRAQLNYQSVVTGMLYVELDFFAKPGEAYTLHKSRGSVLEIPVASSGFSDLAKKLESSILEMCEIDVKKIAENLDTLIVNTNEKIMALDTKAINKSLVASLQNIEKFSGDPTMTESVKNLNALLLQGQDFMKSSNEIMGDVGKEFGVTLHKANNVLDNADTIISPNSPLRYELSLLLKNLGDASISIRALADFIERNPSSIITGKPASAK